MGTLTGCSSNSREHSGTPKSRKRMAIMGVHLKRFGSLHSLWNLSFLRPEYAADINLAKWRQEIVSLSGLPEPFSQPVIIFFVYGQWGRHITGLVRGMAQDSEEYYQILDDNFRP